jgi:hypothetical protein
VLFSDLPSTPAAPPAARPVLRRSERQAFRVPLVPVLALLIALSIILGAPVWLLIFPLMFLRGRHGGRCAPPRGHADYRRPDRSHGW